MIEGGILVEWTSIQSCSSWQGSTASSFGDINSNLYYATVIGGTATL